LFMDEFSEFSRCVLETLRQPMEDGVVTISRSLGSFSFPCRFLLIAASNPCPCGFKGHPKRKCVCTPKQVEYYRKKLSGPILDRIDLFLNVYPVDVEDLTNDKTVLARIECSADIRRRVILAREAQLSRFSQEALFVNAEMRNAHVNRYCRLSSEVEALLKRTVSKYDMSARTYFKLIKVARTIADLAQTSEIEVSHMAEAIQYRTKDI